MASEQGSVTETSAVHWLQADLLLCLSVAIVPACFVLSLPTSSPFVQRKACFLLTVWPLVGCALVTQICADVGELEVDAQNVSADCRHFRPAAGLSSPATVILYELLASSKIVCPLVCP